MDANSFLKRITLIALVTALPTFVSASSPGGGGHSSGVAVIPQAVAVMPQWAAAVIPQWAAAVVP